MKLYSKKNIKINQLEEELAFMDGLFMDLGKWKIKFIEYMNYRIKTDNKNKKIYEEILKECQVLFDIV